MCRIKLRALSYKDISLTHQWNNQEEIKSLYAGHPFPINIEMEEEWYNKILKSNFPTTVFGIELCEGEKLIGISLLKNISLIHRNAEFAIYIGDRNEKGKGFATIATQKTISFGFNELGLRRIYLNVLEENVNAIKLYDKVGFVKEGKKVDSVFRNGRFQNEILMSVINFNDKV